MSGRTYCTQDHEPGNHDASCMPPAEPGNPELRLLRAIFGLCPYCNEDGPMCEHACDLSIRVHVKLDCGCEFTEHRPADMRGPVDGELRVCGSFDHYPLQFAATYSVPQ